MVELKKKVTLKRKVTETATLKQQESLQTNPLNNGKGKKFGGLILLAVIAVVVFFLLMPEKSDNEPFVASQITSESVAQNTDKAPTQEEKQPVSESTQNEKESTPVVEGNKSNNEISENNSNKSNSVSEQENESPTTNETKKDPAIEAASKIIPTREATLVGTIEEKAKLVIRGDFGNGEERKMKLGSEYSVIQNKVNEMYAKGFVY